MSTIAFPFKVGNGLKIVIVKQEKSFESVDGTVVETLTTVPAEEFVEVRDSKLSHQSLVYNFLCQWFMNPWLSYRIGISFGQYCDWIRILSNEDSE